MSNKDFKENLKNSIKEIKKLVDNNYLFADDDDKNIKIEIEIKIEHKQKPFKNFLFKK